MKRWLPMIVASGLGWFIALQYYTTQEAPFGRALERGATTAETWYKIVSALTVLVAFASILRSHLVKVRRRSAGWGYSAVTVLALLISSALGLSSIEDGSAFDWMFNNVFLPLDATMFSLLAFYMASAAYRAFRARNPEATLMLLTAVIVMLGRVPVGSRILQGWPAAVTWIMSYPNMAAKRGILIGLALGIIATSLKILLGVERPYQGAGGGRA